MSKTKHALTIYFRTDEERQAVHARALEAGTTDSAHARALLLADAGLSTDETDAAIKARKLAMSGREAES